MSKQPFDPWRLAFEGALAEIDQEPDKIRLRLIQQSYDLDVTCGHCQTIGEIGKECRGCGRRL